MTERLLLNLLLSITPVFVYQFSVFSNGFDSKSRRSQILMGFVSGLSSVLCMTFPIVSGTHFLWDLRWVPLMLAISYGGFRSGVIGMTIMLAYRAYLGGWLSLLLVTVDAILIFWLMITFRRFQTNYRKGTILLLHFMISFGAYLVAILTILLYFVLIHKTNLLFQHSLGFFVSYGVVMITAYVLSVLLFENLLRQAKLREEMQKADKLKLLAEMTAAIAHEIRNPLTVIKGFIQLSSESMDARNRQYMELAVSEVDRAEGIIKDYLNFAKPQIDNPEIISLIQAVDEICGITTPFATLNQVSIEAKIEPELYINSDIHKLKQIIINILKNSIEALPSGGCVRIRGLKSQGNVVITIEDDGIGMTREQLKRLGEPFYSTKSRGTGLGLMVTFQLIKSLGGTLHYESVPGQGTKARITLPRHRTIS